MTELVKESDEKIEVAKTHGVKASQNFEKAHQVIENARESLKVRLANDNGRPGYSENNK